jgi:hypothetical protein
VVFGWLVGVAALVIAAMVIGNGRERLTLVAVALAACIAVVALAAVVLRPKGFGVQGRHVLVVLALLPYPAGKPLRAGPTSFPFELRYVVWPLVVAGAGLWLIATTVVAARRASSPAADVVPVEPSYVAG